ncbi:MAG: hypothetical protein HY547_01155 [Elusimicrobia bacterium]|nr:hypothetical protein [Elusimicrobiota bacterium]
MAFRISQYCEKCEIPADGIHGIIIADPFKKSGSLNALYECPECGSMSSRSMKIEIEFKPILGLAKE